MSHPRISQCVREQEFKDQSHVIKRKEAELTKRETDLSAKEARLEEEAASLKEQEARLREREEKLLARQKALREKRELAERRRAQRVAEEMEEQRRYSEKKLHSDVKGPLEDTASTQKLLRMSKEESPRLPTRVDSFQSTEDLKKDIGASRGLRRAQGNSQSRDALPISRDYGRR